MSKRHSFLRTRMKELALMGAALILSLVVGELLLRLVGISHPVFVRADAVRGAAHIEGAKGWHRSEGQSWVEINRDGMRGPEVAVEKRVGTFRVALLGDSYIEAVQVPFEKTVGEVLERRLSALRGGTVEVLNFGVGGYGTTQALLTLQHKVWKYSPDLILLAVTTGNDISDNYRPLKRVENVPYHVFRGSNLAVDTSFLQSKEYRDRSTWMSRMLLGLVQHSRLVQLANQVRHSRRASQRQQDRGGATPDELGLDDNIYLPPSPQGDWHQAWTITEGVLRLMRDECRNKRTPFAIVTLTHGIQVHPLREEREKRLRRLGVKDLHYPDRRLAEFGRREGVPVLNLASPMAKQAEERQVFFHGFDGRLGRGHWNQAGHQVAAELLASWIAGGFVEPARSDSIP
jgi:lysophospholipase L1-like esterase